MIRHVCSECGAVFHLASEFVDHYDQPCDAEVVDE